LSKEYGDRIFDLNRNDDRVPMKNFDFNTICKNGTYENVSLLIADIKDQLETSCFFLLDIETNTPIFYQKGVFRTNCVDWYGK
jgi:hypothetical protein